MKDLEITYTYTQTYIHTHLHTPTQVVVGGRNKYTINGTNVHNVRAQDMFRSIQLNINNPHFLIMQGRITKVLNMKPVEVSPISPYCSLFHPIAPYFTLLLPISTYSSLFHPIDPYLPN